MTHTFRPVHADGTTARYRSARDEHGALILDGAIGKRGVTRAIFDRLPGFEETVRLHDVRPLPLAFRKMVNERAYHFSEMALTTLAMAVDAGRSLVGIPVVLNRDFHYRSIVVGTDSGVRTPRDLVGKRVGVRAYSQTTGVWARGLLEDEFGLAHQEVDWVTFEGAHVAEYVDPPHVRRAPEGTSIQGMLASGELDAALIMDPQLPSDVARPLFPDHHQRARAQFEATGIFPVNHVLAVDTGLLAEAPGIDSFLRRIFTSSRDAYVATLHERGAQDRQERHALRLAEIVGDPNPFGLEENRNAIEHLIGLAHHQGLLSRRLTVDEIFLH